MPLSIDAIRAVVATGLALTCVAAHPNGRSTPILTAQTLITTTCERKTEKAAALEILRTRLVDGTEPAEELTVSFDDTTEKLPLFRIKSLTLAAEPVTREGFVKATLSRSDGSKPQPVMLKVGSSAKPTLRLAGFSATGTAVSVGLDECKAVAFSSGQQTPGKPTPQPKS